MTSALTPLPETAAPRDRRVIFEGRPLVVRIGVVAALIFVLPLLSMFALNAWSSRAIETVENAETKVRMAATVSAVAHPALPPVAVVEGLVTGDYAYAARMGRECAVADVAMRDAVCTALADWAGEPARIEVAGPDGRAISLLVASVDRSSSAVIVARDISRLTDMRDRHRQIAVFVVVAFFAMGLVTLLVFLRYEFGALTALVDLLRAYARGEGGARPRRLTTSREVMSLYTSAKDVQRSQEDRAKLSVLSTKMEAAAKIQRGILPEPLALPGAKLAGLMTPAEVVGGDFYDWHRTLGGKVAMVVADVSDKGIGSAMFGVQADSALRAMYESGGDPGEALCRLNDLLSERNSEVMFVTMLLAEFDPATGELWFASAGHEPPVLVRRDGSAALAGFDSNQIGDPPLGLFAGAQYRSYRMVLSPGEAFLLYTDGANEARLPDGTLLGRDVLVDMVAQLAGLPAGTIVARIEEMVLDAIAPMLPGDDLTFVALTRDADTGAAP